MARATCGSSRTRLAAQTQDAAGHVTVGTVEIGRHFLVGAVLQPEIGERIGRQERLDFALLDGNVEQIAGICPPVDIPVRIDAELGQLDREEILVRSGQIADRDDLALEIGELLHAGIGACQHAHAAAMRARGDLDVEALLQRLEPAQRHPESGVALAGRDGLQQLVGRAAIIDEFHIQILLLEESVVDGDRDRRQAYGARIPREPQLARSAGQRGRF